MSKKEVTVCNRCGDIIGDEEAQDRTFSVQVGSKLDAAGSVDKEWYDVDLCNTCMSIELSAFLGELTNSARYDWVKSLLRERRYHQDRLS